MEFLRFGSNIPGSYWGCCAVDIIQDFKQDPDEKAAIQIVDGDGSVAILRDGEPLYAGPTWKDIFEQRIRFGTFSTRDMPNHGFIAILTQWQVSSDLGKKWLKILKDNGFEFLRTVNNSVYSGKSLGAPTAEVNNNDNYVFALFRNIGSGGLADPFTPPKEWTDLSSVAPEVWEHVPAEKRQALTTLQHKAHTECWHRVGPAELKKESEMKTLVPESNMILSGVRPDEGFIGAKAQNKAERDIYLKNVASLSGTQKAPEKAIFGNTVPAAPAYTPHPMEEADYDVAVNDYEDEIQVEAV